MIFSGGKPGPLQSNLVDPAYLGRVAICDHERRDVLHDLGAAAGDRKASDAAELMHCRQATDDRVIAHLHMARESAVVRENDRISDDAVMTDVRVGEKIAAVPNTRPASSRSAAVDRDEFAKAIVVTDLQISRLAAIFQILGLLTDRAIGVEFIAPSGRQRPFQSDVVLEPAILT